VQRAHAVSAADSALGRSRELDRFVWINEAEAVQPSVDVLDPGKACPDNLDRRELALADAAGELVRRREAEVEVGAAQRTTSTSQGA
jgi:hypothetical protein